MFFNNLKEYKNFLSTKFIHRITGVLRVSCGDDRLEDLEDLKSLVGVQTLRIDDLYDDYVDDVARLINSSDTLEKIDLAYIDLREIPNQKIVNLFKSFSHIRWLSLVGASIDSSHLRYLAEYVLVHGRLKYLNLLRTFHLGMGESWVESFKIFAGSIKSLETLIFGFNDVSGELINEIVSKIKGSSLKHLSFEYFTMFTGKINYIAKLADNLENINTLNLAGQSALREEWLSFFHNIRTSKVKKLIVSHMFIENSNNSTMDSELTNTISDSYKNLDFFSISMVRFQPELFHSLVSKVKDSKLRKINLSGKVQNPQESNNIDWRYVAKQLIGVKFIKLSYNYISKYSMYDI
ncbi:hypothetical protein ROZALSC1DRAFT_31564, partial [Rozella allomycis CSF55]